MHNSESLRAVLADLQASVETAGSALQVAEAAHKIAVTRAVLSNQHAEADATAAAVSVAHVRYHAATERCEEARRLLTQAIKAEREQREIESCAAIRVRLDELDALAAAVDGNFAALVTDIRRMRELETSIHANVRREFGRSPWHAPLSFRALKSMAISMSTEANGVSVDTDKMHASTAAASAKKNIVDAFSA